MPLIVHKFALGYGVTELSLPPSATVQHVGSQENKCFIWMCYNPHPNIVPFPKRYLLVDTGEPIEYDKRSLDPLGSIITHAGAYVYHVFEILS